MRINLTTFFLILALTQVCAKGFGQKISLNENNMPLEKALQSIMKQSGYEVFYKIKDVTDQKISIRLQNATVEEAIKASIKNLPLSYKIIKNTIVLTKVEKSFLDKLVDVFNQIDAKGRIIDENGKPLPRATVKTKIGNRYAYTNDYGEFTLQNVEEKAVLIISFLGYESKEVAAAKDLGNIQLIQTSGKLQEVLISTGYQKIDKSQMTGAIAKVKADNLVMNGTNTIEQMLQGKLAGLEVVNNSGVVGTRQTMRVRGTSTLLGSQEPVWVVDGIVQEDPLPFKAAELNRFGKDPSDETALKNFVGSTISWLNPYDIEDITILKDAASTAIYGVKAANGVIVINTKRGKSGTPPSITYSNSFSTQGKYNYNKLNLMNSKDRVDVSREIWEKHMISENGMDRVGFQGILRDYLSDKISYDQFNSGVKQLEINNTDWLNILFRTPLSQNHNISVSGGGINSNYYGSFGYNNQKGQAKGNDQETYNISLNFTSNLSTKFSISARLSGSFSKTTGFKGIDPYTYATTTSRVIPAYNPDGSLSYYRNGLYNYNILNELANSGNENIKNSLNSNISVRYQLPVGLRFESLLGLSYSGTDGESYETERTNNITTTRGYEYGEYGPLTNKYKQSRLPVGGELASLESRNSNYTWRNSINFGKTFNQKHSISGMLGMELKSNAYKGSSGTSYGYMEDMGKLMVNPPLTVLNGTGIGMVDNSLYSSITNTITDKTANTVSYYLTGGYSYDDRYVFSVSVRGDASNRFGQDTRSRYKPVWALGGRWNVAREHWFDKNDWFNDFSIRTSYGYQGNAAENYGPDLIAKMGGSNTLTGEALLNVSNLPYTNLRMEKTQTVNLGVDFGFFKNRITGSVDYYNKRSKDLIVLLDVPFESGIAQMPINGGRLTNSGFDVVLNFIPVRNKDITWTLGANFSRNYNNIESSLLPNSSWNNAISGSYYVQGYAVSSFWVFDYKGLNPNTGIPEYNIPNTKDIPNAASDATAYMTYGGKLNADFSTGVNTSLRYKSLTLSTNMYLSVGGKKILSPFYASNMTNDIPSEYNNLSNDLVNRWRKPGDELNTDIPALPFRGVTFITIPGELTSYSPYTFYNYSTMRVVNASFLRISDVSVSYTLPDAFCKRILTKSVRLGYTLGNPYTFVSKDYKGIDPEVASGSQPLARTHAFTLGITF